MRELNVLIRTLLYQSHDPSRHKNWRSCSDNRQLAAVGASAGGPLPTIFLGARDRERRFWEFFAVNIRNRNTRKAYFVAVSQFSVWCDSKNLRLESIEPMQVNA